MVAISNIFKDKDDKEKLTTIDADFDKADLEAYEVYVTPTMHEPRRYTRTRFFIRLLFLLTTLLFGICLIIGGVLLYRYYTTPEVRILLLTHNFDFLIFAFVTELDGYVLSSISTTRKTLLD